MVNIAKRMRGLKPLLTLRNGQGAAILPQSPAPQLTHIHLRAPNLPGKAAYGARGFWKTHLRRLKYHNPALPVTVDYANGDAATPLLLTLQFEHRDAEVLERIKGNVKSNVVKKPVERVVTDDVTEEEKEILARQQSPNFRDAPVNWKKTDQQVETQEAVDQAAIEAETATETPTESSEAAPPADTDLSSLPSDAVVPSPSASKGGSPLYRRSITLGLRERSSEEIWKWFESRTKCTDVPKTEEDSREEETLALFFKQSAIDRQYVKEGRDAVRKEKADLQRARGESDLLKSEAV